MRFRIPIESPQKEPTRGIENRNQNPVRFSHKISPATILIILMILIILIILIIIIILMILIILILIIILIILI